MHIKNYLLPKLISFSNIFKSFPSNFTSFLFLFASPQPPSLSYFNLHNSNPSLLFFPRPPHPKTVPVPSHYLAPDPLRHYYFIEIRIDFKSGEFLKYTIVIF